MQNQIPLILGDGLAMAAVTLLGFVVHGENPLTSLPRLAATYFPLCLAWFVLAPWLGLFRQEITLQARQFWRPPLAMFLAAPLAAILRGLLLSTPIFPIFALVLAATSALGMLVWRLIFLLTAARS